MSVHIRCWESRHSRRTLLSLAVPMQCPGAVWQGVLSRLCGSCVWVLHHLHAGRPDNLDLSVKTLAGIFPLHSIVKGRTAGYGHRHRSKPYCIPASMLHRHRYGRSTLLSVMYTLLSHICHPERSPSLVKSHVFCARLASNFLGRGLHCLACRLTFQEVSSSSKVLQQQKCLKYLQSRGSNVDSVGCAHLPFRRYKSTLIFAAGITGAFCE